MEKGYHFKLVVASESDGFHIRNVPILLKVANGIDAMSAIQKACKEYCLTEEGKQTFASNCNCFNYGDFDAYVPNSICQKYGIEKVDDIISTKSVNFDAQLVDESEIFPEEDMEME